MRIIGLWVVLFVWLMPANAESAPYWESATINPDLPGYHKSGKSIGSRYFNGARFYVEQTIEVESIGGYFSPISAGTSDPGDIFGAIIALDNQNDMPDSLDLSTQDVVGHTIVDIDWGPVTLESRDYTASLPVTLEPGWYALIFGSGLFGATYMTAAVGPHFDVGTPDYLTRRTHHVETYTTIDTPPDYDEVRVMTWPEVIESYNCTEYSLEPGNEFCTYVSGSEWDGTLEWADASTPSASGYFNGPNSPGYGMRFFINAAVVSSVSIDVLPGDEANKIYPNKGGRFPVAVLSGVAFDATQVNPSTLKLGLGEAAPASAAVISNVDGLHGDDITLKFSTKDTGIFCNDAEVTLSGETYAGEAFAGTDSIDTSDCIDAGCHEY